MLSDQISSGLSAAGILDEVTNGRRLTLKNTAVSRLYLDNFEHIKAYWISYGLDLAKKALAYGADDLDGTIEEERIYHMAGATTPVAASVEALRAAILSAGLRPVLRAFIPPRTCPPWLSCEIADNAVSRGGGGE